MDNGTVGQVEIEMEAYRRVLTAGQASSGTRHPAGEF